MTHPLGNKLYDHQRIAVNQLKTGSILQGGLGSGKTLTSIFYYHEKECEGMTKPKDLYVITTAKKRDTLDWERECAEFSLYKNRSASVAGVQLTIDSWNNIGKYKQVEHAFFIFDEQRVVGSGAWVKAFYKIAKKNNWILLSATPGDTWMDYAPVFIANGFYKNKTEFIAQHVVWNTYVKFPRVDHYVEEGRLQRLKNQITVVMESERKIEKKIEYVIANHDKIKLDSVEKDRWNPLTNTPIKDVSQYCNVMRRIVNTDPSRLAAVMRLADKHRRIIVFYNFNYELEILRTLNGMYNVAEHNGHHHDPVPTTESWIYLVQYMSGSEGWNCIETNTIVFYSQNYSYRMMTQAAGRIDRLNTPFATLYYYHIRSMAKIDVAILKSLHNKKDFNENKFVKGE